MRKKNALCKHKIIMHIHHGRKFAFFIHFIVAQTVLGKTDKYIHKYYTQQSLEAPIAPLTHRKTHSHEVTSEHKPRALPGRRSRERALL